MAKTINQVAREAANARWAGKVTKVQAVAALLKKRGGKATWKEIYDNIEKFYPEAKASTEWQAGIRGVVYRETKKKGGALKMEGTGTVALR